MQLGVNILNIEYSKYSIYTWKIKVLKPLFAQTPAKPSAVVVSTEFQGFAGHILRNVGDLSDFLWPTGTHV